MKKHSPKIVNKPWGHEVWIHNDSLYCGKLLVFPKMYSKFSMHYHINKIETWYVQQGKFIFDWIDTELAELRREHLAEGDVIHLEKGTPHQLMAMENNCIIFEVSTEHFDNDSYRIYKKSPSDLLNDDTLEFYK
jgi:mannose-6-phosphate isomerase-like protein (cupin superfamily)